jgi:hypothetical protein
LLLKIGMNEQEVSTLDCPCHRAGAFSWSGGP